MRIGRKHAFVEQYTSKELQEKLSEFPKRYHHFKLPKQENIWTFHIISMTSNYCIVQLIDKTFELPRGTITSDQPYIHIHFLQEGQTVDITYWMKWKNWKLILIALGIVLSMSLACIFISAVRDKHTFWALSLCFCMFSLFILWLAKNIQHDRLTLRVFEEILERNFSIYVVH